MKKFIILKPVFLNKCSYTCTALPLRHASSSKVPSPGNAGLLKAQKISQAMRIYLERSQSYNEMMKEEVGEFEVGRRYLAGMMGLDPDNITQHDIDEAIEYLMPSGIFDKKARPKMKHPLEIMPKRKAAQFGLDGRPFSTFFYTSKQHYAELLHTISSKMEGLKEIEDREAKLGIRPSPANQVELKGSEWLDVDKVNQVIEEKLLEPEHKSLIVALDHLSRLPHSATEKNFIFKFRLNLQQQNKFKQFEKKQTQTDEKGRNYYEDDGKRKKGRAMVKLFEKGAGDISVNNLSLLEYFPRLADREQFLFPLHLIGLLDRVDVRVEVEGGGPSGQAGAARLALSRCLQNIVSEQEREKLRIAGLLTSDPRTLERQKPGRQGARRGYTWKKR